MGYYQDTNGEDATTCVWGNCTRGWNLTDLHSHHTISYTLEMNGSLAFALARVNTWGSLYHILYISGQGYHLATHQSLHFLFDKWLLKNVIVLLIFSKDNSVCMNEKNYIAEQSCQANNFIYNASKKLFISIRTFLCLTVFQDILK